MQQEQSWRTRHHRFTVVVQMPLDGTQEVIRQRVGPHLGQCVTIGMETHVIGQMQSQ